MEGEKKEKHGGIEVKASNMGTHTLYSPDTLDMYFSSCGVGCVLHAILFIFYLVDKDSILAPLSGVTLMMKAFQFIP